VSDEANQPASTGFWNERTGWKILKEVLLLEPLSGGARWAAAFGSLLLFAFVVQVVTGILLSMNYAPSEKTAWSSVKFIQNEVPLGSFIRAVHHWGSSVMVILLLVHLVQVFVWGAYKRPREFTWMVGVLLLFCTLGLAFTGYLLPWDQKAYWATKVGLGIASTVPFIGDGLRTLLQGGDQIGNLTLTRFFTIHGFILPGLIICLVVVHLYLFRRHGVTPPWWRTESQLKATAEPFWPKQALKDGVLALLFLIGLGFWAHSRPAPLEEQADPSKLYEARPEWYFMFLFQLLSYFKGPAEVVGTFVLPIAFFLILFFWPFLDRMFFWEQPHRNPARRPAAIGLLTLGTVGLIGLTVYAIANDTRMHQPAVAKEPSPKEAAGPIQLLEVAKLYSTNCQACHGVDGSGKDLRKAMPTIPDFTSLKWQTVHSELEIMHRIMEGKEPLMPAYRDKLTKDQNLGLAIYIRAFAIDRVNAVAAGPDKQPPVEPPKEPPTVPPSHLDAEQLYKNYICMSCHDRDGTGKVVRAAIPDIPNFADANWQKEHADDAALAKSIVEGKGKFMPPMKEKPAKEDVDKLVALVRSFSGGKAVVKEESKEPPAKPPDEPKIAVGPKKPPAESGPSAEEKAAQIRVATVIYREYCVNCHGKDGKGLELKAAMPTIPDFTSRSWQEAHSNPQLAAAIRTGKDKMPSFGEDRIREDQLNALVAYLRAFGPERPASAETTTSGEFEERFRRLQEEWDALQRQLEELDKKRKKP
jgi:quinol-cytochrome oxidoreductase complex cytochrome b subunit/mono/diheme cytochrome c family protein